MRNYITKYMSAARKLFFWKVISKYYKYDRVVQPGNYLFICTMPCDKSNNVLHVAMELANSGLAKKITLAPLREYDSRLITTLKNMNIELTFGYNNTLARWLSSAEWIVLDSHFSMYFEKAAGQKIAQLWHAAGAFKRFGLHVPSDRYGKRYEKWLRKEGQQYDFLTISNAKIVDIYRDALFAHNASIVPVGLPRADYILNEANKLTKRASKRKVILYAPTFRDSEKSNLVNIEKLYDNISEEYEIWVRLHIAARNSPLALNVQKAAQKGKNIVDVSKNDYIDVLINSDILITDYSSIIFDYAILGRPILFYPYDLEEYINERGFYEEYSQFVPGPICRNMSELENCIQMAANNEKALSNRVKEFALRHISPLDGNASKRVVAYISGATND